MRKIYLFLVLIVFLGSELLAQPFALSLNNVDGSPYTCNFLEDLGTYKRLRVQANQTTTDGRWELPQTCAFPGNVWRPYTDAEATPIPFNIVIPPTPSSYGALWNSNNGGAPGRLQPVTNGNYYTFNVENITCTGGICNSPHIGVLETPYLPVEFPSVTQSPLADAVGENTPVTITVTSTAPPIENVFCRYTTNEYVNTTIVPVTFVGTTGTAVIPGFPVGTTVKYYIYSTNKTQALIESEVTQYGEVVHDMSTLNWNVNLGTNYPYTVISTTPVTYEYFKGIRLNGYNDISWKVACSFASQVTMTLERSNDARNFSSIHTTTVDQSRCAQPFSFKDSRFEIGINYYRLKSTSPDGQLRYSNIVALMNGKEGFEIVGVHPNLITNGQMNINLTSSKSGKADFVVTDVHGKKILATSRPILSGSNIVLWNVNSLSAGVYMLQVINDQGVRRNTRFVVR